jgi:hypothetical protein
MIVPSYVVVGARNIAGQFIAKAATIDAEVEVALEKNAQALLLMIQSRAPVRTGAYRASWHIERQGNQRLVGSGAPYGRRLEFGFMGTDALGRSYHQAPQPHVRPSADAIETQYVADMLIVATRHL